MCLFVKPTYEQLVKRWNELGKLYNERCDETESLQQQLQQAERDWKDMWDRREKAEQHLEQLLDALSAWRKTIEGSGAEETAQYHLYAVIDEVRAGLSWRRGRLD